MAQLLSFAGGQHERGQRQVASPAGPGIEIQISEPGVGDAVPRGNVAGVRRGWNDRLHTTGTWAVGASTADPDGPPPRKGALALTMSPPVGPLRGEECDSCTMRWMPRARRAARL